MSDDGFETEMNCQRPRNSGAKIPTLLPRGTGWHFVVAGDSCSGVPGHIHEANLEKVSEVIQRLAPLPQSIIFPGDQILGLTTNEQILRSQWEYFLNYEMAWAKELSIPTYHSTGNHTTYSKMSERVHAEVITNSPRNGAPGQEGLSYYIRERDLLFVFIHTLCSELGGEGHLETEWLEETLEANSDARWKFVVGHHPAHPVNGYLGSYQRCIGDEYITKFWRVLSDHKVIAYICSHILAFDVQCHEGVLQITSAGAGTQHRMPADVEYLHCVQITVDQEGLRYQVLDDAGNCREALSWPPRLRDALARSIETSNSHRCIEISPPCGPLLFRLSGDVVERQGRQTLVAGRDSTGTMPLWVGFVGRSLQLTISVQAEAGRSPHQWTGPKFEGSNFFDLEILLHPDMGPGGFLWRNRGSYSWTSFKGLSSWGPERLNSQLDLWIGHSGKDAPEPPFAGEGIYCEVICERSDV